MGPKIFASDVTSPRGSLNGEVRRAQVVALLALGADGRTADTSGETALMRASLRGSLPAVEALLPADSERSRTIYHRTATDHENMLLPVLGGIDEPIDHLWQVFSRHAQAARRAASADVNARTTLYTDAYDELRNLRDVFRTYLIAVKIIQERSEVCQNLIGIPLGAAERVLSPLPEEHPAELTFSVANYVYSDGRARWYLQSQSSATNGGIALRGKEFFPIGAFPRVTPAIAAVEREMTKGVSGPAWTNEAGRKFVTIELGPQETLRRVPVYAKSPGGNLNSQP